MISALRSGASGREEPLTPSVESVAQLYRKYAPALWRVREQQKRLYATRGNLQLERVASWLHVRALLASVGLAPEYHRLLKPQFDDLEAESTYLLLRELRPQTVVEIGPDGGWSTSWLLAALRDNGRGQLYSYDRFDHSTRTVPRDLAAGRWTFSRGDVKQQLHGLPPRIDYLFIDCAHTEQFARWYVRELFPRLEPGTPIGIHDIFPERPGESQVIREWLLSRGVTYFTASPQAAPAVHARLRDLKRELGIDELIHHSQKNPMIFFRRPQELE